MPRASFQTRGYDGALRVVQALLHHRSMQTTAEYIGLSTESITRDEFLRSAVLLAYPHEATDPIAEQGSPTQWPGQGWPQAITQ